MGYEAPKKTFKITFEDEDMAGLVIRATSPSMGDFMEIAKLADLANTKVSAEDLQKIMPVFDLFVENLVEWNLESKGVPVELTVQGLFRQELPWIMRVVDGWMRAVASVPAPLVQPLPNGEQFQEQLMIPMEPLSQNLAS